MKAFRRNHALLPLLALELVASFLGCADSRSSSEVPKEAQSVTQVAYVVLLFRKERGRLPDSMDEIVEFDDSTPQTDDWGNEFTYIREGNEFTISSAGPDKQAGTKDDLRAILQAPATD